MSGAQVTKSSTPIVSQAAASTNIQVPDPLGVSTLGPIPLIHLTIPQKVHREKKSQHEPIGELIENIPRKKD